MLSLILPKVSMIYKAAFTLTLVIIIIIIIINL